MLKKVVPVKIDIEDQLRSSCVISVIDNPTVRKFIFDLRERFKIRHFHNPYEDEAKGGLPFNLLKSLQAEIMKFREDQNLDPVFDNVFLKAITCNKIVSEDFIPTFLKIKNISPEFGNPHYWIEITPYTTWPELQTVFKSFKSQLKEARTNPRWHNRLYLPTLTRKMPSDKNILDRDRRFYYEWLENKNPKQIAIDAPERKSIDVEDYESIVEKALLSYRKFVGDI